MYSDVHMLSHLVGSSNQANIVKITELEIELANAHDKIKKLIIKQQCESHEQNRYNKCSRRKVESIKTN